MGNITLPALDIAAPNPTQIMNNYAQAIRLQAAAQADQQQSQLTQQQIDAGNASAAQAQQTSSDNMKAQEYLAEHVNDPDPSKIPQGILGLGLNPAVTSQTINKFAQVHQIDQNLSDEQLAAKNSAVKYIGNGLAQIDAETDPQKKLDLTTSVQNDPQWQSSLGILGVPNANVSSMNPITLKAARTVAGYQEFSATQEMAARALAQKAASAPKTAAELAGQAAATDPTGQPTPDAVVAQRALTLLQQGKAKPASSGPPAHITTTQGIMGWNPTTGAYDIKLGQAPPTYAQAVVPTRTADIIDPNTGLPTVMAYNPETRAFDKPVGTSATGAYGHEASQAGAVVRAGTDLIGAIQANKADLGKLQTWVQKYGLNTPIANPKLANLQARLTTFSALQPSMHGFRGANAMDTFDKVIGGLQKNPDATISSIRGIMQTASAINPNLAQGGAPAVASRVSGTPTPATHVISMKVALATHPGATPAQVQAWAQKNGYQVQ